jgi:hypothetical protein
VCVRVWLELSGGCRSSSPSPAVRLPSPPVVFPLKPGAARQALRLVFVSPHPSLTGFLLGTSGRSACRPSSLLCVDTDRIQEKFPVATMGAGGNVHFRALSNHNAVNNGKCFPFVLLLPPDSASAGD